MCGPSAAAASVAAMISGVGFSPFAVCGVLAAPSALDSVSGEDVGWLLPPPRSLFDNTPLRELLGEHFDFSAVGRSIQAGQLEALSIAAAGYMSARSVSFYEARPGLVPWHRLRRAGEPATLSLDHLMASVAVPFLFQQWQSKPIPRCVQISGVPTHV